MPRAEQPTPATPPHRRRRPARLPCRRSSQARARASLLRRLVRQTPRPLRMRRWPLSSARNAAPDEIWRASLRTRAAMRRAMPRAIWTRMRLSERRWHRRHGCAGLLRRSRRQLAAADMFRPRAGSTRLPRHPAQQSRSNTWTSQRATPRQLQRRCSRSAVSARRAGDRRAAVRPAEAVATRTAAGLLRHEDPHRRELAALLSRAQAPHMRPPPRRRAERCWR